MQAQLIDVLTIVEQQPADAQQLKQHLRSEVFGSIIPQGLRAKVYQILLFGYSRKDDHVVTRPVQAPTSTASEGEQLKADCIHAWRELGMASGKMNENSLAKMLKLLLFCLRKRGLVYDRQYGLAQLLAPFVLLAEEEPLLGEQIIPEVASAFFTVAISELY